MNFFLDNSYNKNYNKNNNTSKINRQHKKDKFLSEKY
nr:MAG TPA: hypothetical protein [Caudoviricetes sp.]DAV81554.1 MAG TPA: hypothetical protein [Caudoviricetes sp.]